MKKRLISTAAALLLAAFTAVPLPVPAEGEEDAPEQETEERIYSYALDTDGNAELYDFLLSDTFEGDLVIPAEVDGHPVDYIGNACFYMAEGITTVTIPAGVTNMGEDVFLGCTSLEYFVVEEGNTVFSAGEDGILFADDSAFLFAYPAAKEGESYAIPDGVEEIAPSAFGYAQHLKEVTVPDSVVYVDQWAFSYANIEKITIGSGVTDIGDYAFAYCSALREVELVPGLDYIGNAAFYQDTALTQITLPNTLTYIGQYAFCSTGLTCITIPNGVETISYCAFGYTGDPADSSFGTVDGFIIYGEPGTMAQVYASAYDSENDYQNSFVFTAVEDADIPYELGGGTLYEDSIDASAQEASGESTPAQTDPSGNSTGLGDELGAGRFGNNTMQTILGIAGGAAVILAVVLIIAFVGRTKPEDEEADEKEEPEEAQDDAE